MRPKNNRFTETTATKSIREMSGDNNSQPKSMSRARMWTDDVENLYRFQQAGYRDELEYRQIKQMEIDRWPETGFVKKLQRRDNTFYYYSKKRECEDREVHKVKVYVY
ncbi:hypothetical protein Q7C36_015672 [Tachysurus vachellii]|uniref:Meiosis expressed gene 1 protein homolog n=2 Tax=Tachysurus TaxID=641818 RepID=A0AA88M7C6_TACVA|nr:hypothetical protein Q7C36_015672 [Tachysurus vachellii]